MNKRMISSIVHGRFSLSRNQALLTSMIIKLHYHLGCPSRKGLIVYSWPLRCHSDQKNKVIGFVLGLKCPDQSELKCSLSIGCQEHFHHLGIGGILLVAEGVRDQRPPDRSSSRRASWEILNPWRKQ